MKVKYFLKNTIIVSTFLAAIFSVKNSFSATPDELIEQGKSALIEEFDVYTAETKFADALQVEPNNPKANFWRAVTIIFSNPNLKQTLINTEIIDSNDKFALFDQENEIKYSYTPVNTIIIDNKDQSYSEVGSDWQTLLPQPDTAYSDDSRIHTAGSGTNKAIWMPNITTAGDYDVFVWWPYANNNAQDTKYTVYYDGGTKTITFNQRRNYERWVRLGRFRFSPGQPTKVELSDDTSSGQVVADAIKLEFVGEYIPETEAILTGDWQDRSNISADDGAYKEISAGTGGSCQWNPNITLAGKYQVVAYWPAYFDNATDAVFTITPAGASSVTISVNQQKDNLTSVSLGLYDFQAGVGNTITLSQNAKDKVVTDGIKIIPVRSSYPNLTQWQSELNTMLTEIGQALNYLGNLNATFQDSADLGASDDTGSPVITELDYADALMLKAGLNLLKAKINIFSAYEMNNIDVLELQATYKELLTANYILNRFTQIGRLTVDSATKLSNAKTTFIEGINGCISAYNFITTETDVQTDDLITLNPIDAQRFTDTVNPKLQEILENLNGTLASFTITSDDMANLLGETINPEDAYFKMLINWQAFFDNPKQLRDLLPQLDNNDNILRSTFPDPTMGGVLPKMTQEELNGLFNLGPGLHTPQVYFTEDTVSVTLTWDKDTYADFVSYKIYRSTTDEVNETSTKVYESTDKSITTFTGTIPESGQRVFYYRLYTYYSDGDKIASEMRRMVTKIYVNINNTSGKEDGSPEHPYKLLSDAVASSYGSKICVAEGTYNENESSLSFFRGLANLILEGGYEAVGWTRDVKAHPTIIDGTGLGADRYILGIYSLLNITIDGFVITGAQNKGIRLSFSGMMLKNCILTNLSDGILTNNSSLSIQDSIITENRWSGIVVSYDTSLTLTDSEVSKNQTNAIYISYIPSGQNIKIENCVIKDNGDFGVYLYNVHPSNTIIKNNLIVGNGSEGILSYGDGNATIINNTIVNNSNYGISWIPSSNSNYLIIPTIKNNIITGHIVGINFERGEGTPVIDYNDVWNNSTNYSGCSPGAHDISADPLFVSGTLGNYYLSQIAVGQTSNSPAVDAGSDSAENLGLQNLTTRTDKIPDTGVVDLGYHYAASPGPAGPVLATIGDKSVAEGSLLEFTLQATDADGDNLIYSVSNLPPGATFNTTTQTFSWIPTYEQAGIYTNIHFEVTDGNLTDSEDITITVNNVNRAPITGTITPSAGSSGANKRVTFTTTYSDPDGWENIKEVYFLVNTKIKLGRSFYARYDQNSNKLYLSNDNGDSWLGGYSPGSSNLIENSYAKLNCSKTKVSGSGTTLTIKWSVTFKSTFTGSKNTYLYVSDDTGGSSEWTQKGTWTIARIKILWFTIFGW